MATNALQTSQLDSEAAQLLRALDEARARTLALVAHLDDEQLERVYSPIMSPLAWDLGHIAAYEDLWLANRHAGLSLLRPELAELYDAFETPRAVRGEIEALAPSDAHAYLRAVRGRTAEVISRVGVGDGMVGEMVVRHELQHSETMSQTLAIAGLLATSEPPLGPLAGPGEWMEIPAGPFAMGAGPEGFAYDNERPRHTAETARFAIARQPVTNASWMQFSESGGYARPEWWSQEGWAWRMQENLTQHPSIAAGHPQAPVCHISWFEAEAFARAHETRLPSEAEWEKAAGCGALDAVGRVWEWTQSTFGGYPGFVAHPYREYSEVFFGDAYRVLRGGSWATAPRVAGPTFRNWDLPQRRQIFAGLRLAADAAR
jgi:gamma-glutamyl hercynylcysteine S-oxide synthase